MACCAFTAYFMNLIIRSLDVLDLKIINIQYNDFDDPTLWQEQPQSAVKSLQLRVEKMTCAACVHAVEDAISGVAGVDRVSVSLTLKRATLSYDQNRVTQADIVDAIRMAGYGAEIGERTLEDNVQILEQTKQMTELRSAFSEAALVSGIMGLLDSPKTFGISGVFSEYARVQFLLQVAFASYVQLYNARWIHQRGWVRRGFRIIANMDTLISSSLLLGIAVSLFNVALEGFEAQTYFVSGCFLTTVITAGRYLDAVLRRKSAANLAQLFRLQNETMLVQLAKTKKFVPASLLQKDEEVILEPMSTIPCDCFVLEGSTTVDEATMTGEARPVPKSVGSQLMSGTKNISGRITAVIAAEQQESSLARLTASISAATDQVPEASSYVHVIMRHFVHAVFMIAALSFVSNYCTVDGSSIVKLNSAAQRAMAVLAAACPCAFGLASPSAAAAGIDAAWAAGVILMGGERTLRALTSLTHVVMDKTGTLTQGRLYVTNCVFKPELDERFCYGMLFLAEKEAAQSHPVGQAVFQWALNKLDSQEKERFARGKVTRCDIVAGQGASCDIQLGEQPRLVHIGSARYLFEAGITLHNGLSAHDNVNSSLVHFALDGMYAGCLQVEDTIRQEAPRTIRHLQANGLDVSMLTGDAQQTAAKVAMMLDIPVLSARSLPHEKQAWIKSIQQKGGNVAMVGDGINDSLAQASADVGILLSLTRAAMTGAADAIVMSPTLEALPKLLRIAQMTINQAEWNVKWAIGYNVFSVTLASGVLSKWGLAIDASLAGVLMAMSSLTILSMSLLLRRHLAAIVL